MKYVKVKEKANMVRDMSTGAVLSTDNSALEAYKKAKSKMGKIDTLEEKVQCIEEKLDLLLDLMQRNK